MKFYMTLFLLAFFVSSYAQSYDITNLEQAEVAENVLFGPDYIDYRRISTTKFTAYNSKKDSTTYYYPYDSIGMATVKNKFSLIDGSYSAVQIDSFILDQNNYWTTVKQYLLNQDGDFELHSIQTRKYKENVADTMLTVVLDTATSEWKKTTIVYFDRFPSGDIEKVIFKKWNENSEEWDFLFSFLYNEARETLESKGTYSWTVYEWDDMNRPVSKLKKKYNTASDTFENVEFVEYKWIDDVTQWGLGYDWDNLSESWVYKRRIVRNYDAEGRIDNQLVLDSIGVNEYKNKTKNEFSYDDNGHEILVLNSSWGVSKWINTGKQVQAYDDQDHLVLRSSYTWDSDLNDLTIRREDRTYYEEYENGLVSIQDLNKVAVKLFPNPTTEFITFEIEQPDSKFDITIYSALGRSVLAQKSSNGTNIDISQLATGQYFYILKGNDFGASGSFLKE